MYYIKYNAHNCKGIMRIRKFNDFGSARYGDENSATTIYI